MGVRNGTVDRAEIGLGDRLGDMLGEGDERGRGTVERADTGRAEGLAGDRTLATSGLSLGRAGGESSRGVARCSIKGVACLCKSARKLSICRHEPRSATSRPAGVSRTGTCRSPNWYWPGPTRRTVLSKERISRVDQRRCSRLSVFTLFGSRASSRGDRFCTGGDVDRTRSGGILP